MLRQIETMLADFGSVEVAYNIFETYRGGEAGFMYGRLLVDPICYHSQRGRRPGNSPVGLPIQNRSN